MESSSTRRRQRFVRLIASLFAAFGLSLILTAVTSAQSRVSEIDFHVFYESAQAWNSARDLYETTAAYPNLNPPHFVVAFALLTQWPERTAVLVLMLVNVASLMGVGVLVWRELRLPRTFMACSIAMAAAGFSTGVLVGLEEGHPIGLLALCSTGAWVAHRRGHHVVSGLLLGVLISIKPFLACMLVVPLVWSHWRVVAIALAGAGALTLAGVALAGPESMVRWMETGRQVTWFHHPMNASLAGLIARGGWGWPVWATSVAVLLGVTGITLRRSAAFSTSRQPASTGNDGFLDSAWLAAGLASLLLSPLGWVYYVPLLAGPLTAVALRRPSLLAAGAGLVWPVPALMLVTSAEGVAAVTICSITTWSLLAMWVATVRTMDADRLRV